MARDGRTPSTGCVLWALAGLLALGVIPFAVAALTDGDETPAAVTSTTTEAAVSSSTTEPASETVDEPTPVTADQTRYSVTYRVETFSGADAVVDTEVRHLLAPFSSEVISSEGEPSDPGAVRERTTQVLGGFETESTDQIPTVLTVAPGPPTRLAHFAGDLARAVELGSIEFGARRLQILGTGCEIYRTKAPLDVARLEPATDDDFTDLCIAPDGMVLREEWHTRGALFRRRTVVAIDRGARAGGFELEGFKLPADNGGGRVRRLQPDSTAPGVDHLLPELPAPYEAEGRFVFVADQVDTGATQVDIERLVALVDVFVGPGGTIAVENGASTAALLAGEEAGLAVDVAGADSAWATVTTSWNEVVVTIGRRFVRLTSNLPVDDLVALADSLRPVEGTGEVTPVDDDEADVTGRVAPEDAER